MDFRYDDSLRLKRGAEFAALREGSAKLYSRNFLVLVKACPHPDSRLGIIVTKKVDKRAVVRNRIKRRIREIFRLNRFKLNGNFDIVVIARKDAGRQGYPEIERQIVGALAQKGYLKNRP